MAYEVFSEKIFQFQYMSQQALPRLFLHIKRYKVPEGNQPLFFILFLGYTTPLRFVSVFFKHA